MDNITIPAFFYTGTKDLARRRSGNDIGGFADLLSFPDKMIV
jgi:hypothetical protein